MLASLVSASELCWTPDNLHSSPPATSGGVKVSGRLSPRAESYEDAFPCHSRASRRTHGEETKPQTLVAGRRQRPVRPLCDRQRRPMVVAGIAPEERTRRGGSRGPADPPCPGP